MPIWLRRFTFNKLKEHYDKKSEEEGKISKQYNNAKSKIAKPNIKPSYSTKVPRK